MAFVANQAARPGTGYGLVTAGLALAGPAAALFAPAGLQAVAPTLLVSLAAAFLLLTFRRRWPSPVHLLADLVVVGLVCLARDPAMPVWQIPPNWPAILHLSTPGLVAFLLLYLIASCASAMRAERHLSLIEMAVLLSVPLQMNLAFALAGDGPMTQLGALFGFASATAQAVGRALTLCALTSGICKSFGLLIRGRPSRDLRLYALLIGVALAASLTPLVANLPDAMGALPQIGRALLALVCAAIAQAGLWCIVFLLTGVAMDALQGRPPNRQAIKDHARKGLVKGGYYGGLFFALLLVAQAVVTNPLAMEAWRAAPLLCGLIGGALLYPLATTLVASADETPPFFGRLRSAYAQPPAYLRGSLVGGGSALAIQMDLPGFDPLTRFLAMALVGALAYAGVDLALDLWRLARGRRRSIRNPRFYLLGIILGGFVAGALGWYFDARQLAVVIAKFWAYVDLDYAQSGRAVTHYGINALFSKWGTVDLGPVGGGVRLFYAESLSGVINWALAAPLFSINFFLLAALFQRRLAPLREMLSAKGIEGLVEQTIRVLRWGLWMAPVIYSFLRLSPDPAWYNQDGAVRTLLATGAQLTMPEADFRAWSLTIFTGLLAYDWLRVVIWFDHMGVRVATLVNLSFVGGDALDEWGARFTGHAARTRVVPEGIRRFATWAPLLIPFYIPRDSAWDQAWSTAERWHNTGAPMAPPVFQLSMAYATAGLAAALLIFVLAQRLARPRGNSLVPSLAPSVVEFDGRHVLSNGLLRSEIWPDGRGFLHVHGTARRAGAIDITRRPRDPLHLRGMFFYVSDRAPGAPLWSVGYEPTQHVGDDYAFEMLADSSVISHSLNGIAARLEIRVAEETAVELRTLTLVNRSGQPRKLVLTSYAELALNEPGSYLQDPEFNSMHVETWFVAGLSSIFARNRLLRDRAKTEKLRRMSPEATFQSVRIDRGQARLVAYEDSRIAFVGHGTKRQPDALCSDCMRPPSDEGRLYTFDPVAAFRLEIDLDPGADCQLTFVSGHGPNIGSVAALAAQWMNVLPLSDDTLDAALGRQRNIRVLQPREGSALPYAFSDEGRMLSVGPSTPRPWFHVLANPQSCGMVVSNRGSVYSFAGNSRHNGLTTWGFDPTGTSLDGQLVYVADLERGVTTVLGTEPIETGEDFSTSFTPGEALIHKRLGELDLSMTLFVPPDLPADLRILTLRNTSDQPRRLRVAVLFDLALDQSPFESLGKLDVERAGDTVLARHTQNSFVTGTVFAATNLDRPTIETVRNRFIGRPNRDMGNPVMVDTGAPDRSVRDDDRRIAGFCGEIDLGAGQQREVVIVLGQTATRSEAIALAARLRQPDEAQRTLMATRHWWQARLSGTTLDMNHAQGNALLNTWLHYQILVSRLWGRLGPNQRGGAFGYRDQLQDVMPLVFHDAALVRSQILLHAAQQFPEGDVLKWWHPAPDGRTGIGLRTQASDPHLWLPHVLCTYLEATGDMGILDADIPYIDGVRVPKHDGGTLIAPRPAGESDTLYEHCLRGIEWSLARLGAHGLPLYGSGDWNDGIDVAGLDGRGESVWLAFFLYRVINDMLPIVEARGETERLRTLKVALTDLAAATESAWMDGRYVLGFDDAGAVIEQVSVMTAAWPILSGAVTYERGLAALEAGLAALEKPDRILLLSPPFDESSNPYPGRIADYPPGVRENGAQYTHGATWVIDAWLRLSDLAALRGDAAAAQAHADRALASWRKISPLGKAEGDALWIYGLAPNQQPADIYDGAGHAGRGGWSWYTGSAARMLSTGYALAGVTMLAGTLQRRQRPFSRKAGDVRAHEVGGTPLN